MRSYLSLVPISARVHKRQSRMTRICIALAVFLVTAIFSMAEMWIRAEETAMKEKHGDYHLLLCDVEEETAEEIGARKEVSLLTGCRVLNEEAKEDYTMGGRRVVLYGTEETYLTEVRKYDAEGSFPKKEDEAALSADARKLLGVSLGDTVVLHTPAGEFTYSITAFWEDDSEWNESFDGFCVYMQPAALEQVCAQNKEEGKQEYFLRFREHTKVQRVLPELREQYGLTEENMDENTAVLGLMGASSNQSVRSIYPLAVLCFLLILSAGVLMISSCMNSNVAQRKSFFGMLRCIGASRKQIIRFVRLEALNWCKTAIPAGCALGVLLCWLLCAVLRLLVKGEWVDMPLFGVSLSGIICGAAVGMITVFLAAHAPAKWAAEVSPVMAVQGETEAGMGKLRVSHIGSLPVEGMLGVRHACTSKKNLFLMTGSFALTIVLFLVFTAALDLVHRLLPSESSFSPDLTIQSESSENGMDRELAEQIAELPGIKEAFGTMYLLECPILRNGEEETVDLVSYDEFMLESVRHSIASGSLSEAKEAEGLMAVFDEGCHMSVGDVIRIGETETEICCIASEGLGSVSGAPVVAASEELFRRMTGEEKYLLINVLLDKDAPQETIDELRQLAGENVLIDRRGEKDEMHGSYLVFRFAAYGFLSVIAFITVLNIMNSISMGVSARIRQYGAMRAVGMENGQIVRMIAAEAAAYAAFGLAAGSILGLLLHRMIYVRVIVTHFGGDWRVPYASLALIVLLVILSCIAAVAAPAARIRRMAITETINEL